MDFWTGFKIFFVVSPVWTFLGVTIATGDATAGACAAVVALFVVTPLPALRLLSLETRQTLSRVAVDVSNATANAADDDDDQ